MAVHLKHSDRQKHEIAKDDYANGSHKTPDETRINAQPARFFSSVARAIYHRWNTDNRCWNAWSTSQRKIWELQFWTTRKQCFESIKVYSTLMKYFLCQQQIRSLGRQISLRIITWNNAIFTEIALRKTWFKENTFSLNGSSFCASYHILSSNTTSTANVLWKLQRASRRVGNLLKPSTWRQTGMSNAKRQRWPRTG